jgi:hypothetical protein
MIDVSLNILRLHGIWRPNNAFPLSPPRAIGYPIICYSWININFRSPSGGWQDLCYYRIHPIPSPDASGDPGPPGVRETTNSLSGKESHVRWTILVMLLILWLLGWPNGYSLGGVIHALPIIAIIFMLVQVEADCSDGSCGRRRLTRSKKREKRSGQALPKLAVLSAEKVAQPTVAPYTYREEQPL